MYTVTKLTGAFDAIWARYDHWRSRITSRNAYFPIPILTALLHLTQAARRMRH